MTTTADSPTAYGTPADQAAVASLTQRVIAAWAYHDSEAFANVFTEDGTMILPGVYLKGRKAIYEFLVDAYQNQYKGTQVTGKPIDMRFLNATTAILLSQGGVMQKGESEVTREAQIRASWLVVKEDGQWYLAAYQNSPRHSAA
jgi:uncharacterized protein (TIGR02246 family)